MNRMIVIGFLMNIHAQQPPDKKQGDDGHNNRGESTGLRFWVQIV
jgi:hypothetical protein